MIPMFQDDIQSGDDCMIIGCHFTDGSIKNLGKRVKTVRQIEEGLWLCRPMAKGLHGVNTTTGLIGVKARWLMKINDPKSGLKANLIPINPLPSGAAKTLIPA